MSQKMHESALKTALKDLPGWALENGELVRILQFKDFVAAMVFVNQAAELAEEAGHHPDIDIRYNRVRLALVTHDESGITLKDIDMATRLGSLAK